MDITLIILSVIYLISVHVGVWRIRNMMTTERMTLANFLGFVLLAIVPVLNTIVSIIIITEYLSTFEWDNANQKFVRKRYF